MADRITRVKSLMALVLVVPFVTCGYDRASKGPMAEGPKPPPTVSQASVPGPDLLDFGILQRTCALYVAIRSGSLDHPAAFGGEIDDSSVHWNMCPGGTKVACAPPGADTTNVGIPWPYPDGYSNE